MRRTAHTRALRPLLAATLIAALPAVARAAVYDDILADAYTADGPGAAAIVVRDGEVLYRGARGMADLELGVALSPDQVFRLGSITKQFTAAAILLLAERGELTLTDPIESFLPDYPTQGHTITLHDLLTHTSGVHSYTAIPGYMGDERIRADLTTEELVDVFDDLPMDFAPGERWSYSNSGYVLLGAVIEAVADVPYCTFVEREIFDPLGLEHTHCGEEHLIPGRAEGYTQRDDEWIHADWLSMTQPHAAGALLSTVDDLTRWNAALFGGELLTPESTAAMTQPVELDDGETSPYGYGLGIGTWRGEPQISHGGGIHGFSTNALWLPESKVYVAVLSNFDSGANPGYVARRMAAEAMGKPVTVHEAIELPDGVLADYSGVYTIDEETTATVTLDEGRLYTRRADGPRREIYPSAKDRFFYEQSFAHLAFERDDDDRVVRMLIYQDADGEPEVAERTGDAKSTGRSAADVDPELYDLWAGTYEIKPGFELVITRDGDRLISQATGQPAFELHPESTTRYFVKEFEAELEFVPGASGRATEAVLHQGGRETHAKRID